MTPLIQPKESEIPDLVPSGCSSHFQGEIHLTEEDVLKIVGTIQSCVAGQLVVQADALVAPLDIGYIQV